MWFVKSIHVLISAAVVAILVLNIIFVENYMAIPPVFAIWSLAMTMFTNPGVISSTAVYDDAHTDEQKKLMDEFAPAKHGFVLRPTHSHFSRHLGIMVMDYDHYCPWVNNAIGILNIRFFIQFVFWTVISCFYTYFIIINAVLKCRTGSRTHCSFISTSSTSIQFQLIISTLSGAFTGVILYSQISNIAHQTTTIGKLKSINKPLNTWKRYFKGHRVGIFLPTPNNKYLMRNGLKTITECAEKLTNNGIKVALLCSK